MFSRLITFGKYAKLFILKQLERLKTSENITTFQSLKSINILLWNDILETNNILLLDKDFNEAKTYSDKQRKVLNDRFNLLYDEYFIKLNNSRAKAELKKTQSKVALQLKLMIITEAINTLLFIVNNQKYIRNSLEKENKVYENVKYIVPTFKADMFSTIDENIKKLTKILTSLDLEYKRNHSEESKKEEYNFEKQIVDVEQILGRSLDLSNCSVIKWISYINKVQEIIKQQEKANGKRKG